MVVKLDKCSLLLAKLCLNGLKDKGSYAIVILIKNLIMIRQILLMGIIILALQHAPAQITTYCGISNLWYINANNPEVYVDMGTDMSLTIAITHRDKSSAVMRVDSTGKLLWHRSVNPGGSYDSRSTDVAYFEPQGLTVVAAEVDLLVTVPHVVVMVIDDSGNLVWHKIIGTGTNPKIEIGLAGIVVGFTSLGGSRSISFVKLDWTGQMVDAYRVSPLSSGDLELRDFALNPYGNIIFVGVSYSDAIMGMIRNNGSLAWEAKLDDTTAVESLNSIAYDPLSDLYLAVGIQKNGVYTAGIIVVLDTLGTIDLIIADDSLGRNIEFHSVALQRDPIWLIAGYIDNQTNLRDMYIAAFDVNLGDIVWTKAINSPDNSNDNGTDIVATTDRIALTGFTDYDNPPTNAYNMMVTLLSPEGSFVGCASCKSIDAGSLYLQPWLSGASPVAFMDTITVSMDTAIDLYIATLDLKILESPITVQIDTSAKPQLTAVVSGGQTPYSYLWSTGANTQSITATTSGQYWVHVTDGRMCKRGDTVTISLANNDTTSNNNDSTNTAVYDPQKMGEICQIAPLEYSGVMVTCKEAAQIQVFSIDGRKLLETSLYPERALNVPIHRNGIYIFSVEPIRSEPFLDKESKVYRFIVSFDNPK